MKKLNQLPHRQYLIIGNGRLSQHLQYYFTHLGMSFQIWNRQKSDQELSALLASSSAVLLAISDDALLPFYEKYLKSTEIRTVHFSGAFHDSRLIGCHPLMTFTDKLCDLPFYKSLHFGVTGVSSIQEIFPELPNPSFILPPENKAFYHAWCVLCAAGTQTLWMEAEKNFKNLGVPEQAFHLYLQKICENYLKLGSQALSGPWVRKDQKTIQKNLDALEKSTSHKIYELLMGGLS